MNPVRTARPDDPHHLARQYALNTLPERKHESFQTHLEQCQTDLSQLTETALTLALATQPIEPPPALRKRILAAARAERRS